MPWPPRADIWTLLKPRWWRSDIRAASKALVIDAAVAGAAGDRYLLKPACARYRDLLQDILEICHRMVITADISAEWRRHQGTFARRWATQMHGQKRRKVVKPAVGADEPLRVRVLRTANTAKQRDALSKDMCLVEAALGTDCIVISLDRQARRLFGLAAARVAELRNIAWVVPDEMTSEELREWLQGGATTMPEMLLGHVE